MMLVPEKSPLRYQKTPSTSSSNDGSFDCHSQPFKVINSRCLKIPKKVSFNIASEASYVYILSSLKTPKTVNFGECLKTWGLWSNSGTRYVNFNWTKNSEKCQNWTSQLRHFGWFSNFVRRPKLRKLGAVSFGEKY